MKFWRSSLLIVVLVLIAGVIWASVRDPEQDRWATVERRDLVIAVPVEGELAAEESADLGPPAVPLTWNFKISFLIPEGTEVRAGMPVMRFDTSDYERVLRQKTAERDTAAKELEKRTVDLEIERRKRELSLAEAQAELRRARFSSDLPEGVQASRELELARLERSLAERQITFLKDQQAHRARQGEAELADLQELRDRASLRVQELQEQMQQMTVLAPRSGTVIYKRNWRGEKNKIGDSVWKMQKVLQIPDLTRMRADGMVAEESAGRLREGQTVRLRLDAFPDREYVGQVHSIESTVQNKSRRSREKVVRLHIVLQETDTERMRPGMRFRGEIEVERAEQVLALPLDAVLPGSEGPSVFTRGLLGSETVRPTFGRRNGELLEVVSGLEEGQQVLRQPGARRGGR